MGNFSGSLASPLGPEWKSEDQCSVSVTVIGISPLRIVEANMQEKSLEETNEVGEVVKMLGKAAQMKMTSKQLKEEVGKVVTKANPEAGEEFNKCDISFPHEPGAGGADCKQSKNKKTMEKATLLKLMSSEIRLKYAIKALDSLCNTEAETLSWDKLERISERLEEHWYSYENAFTAYQELFSQHNAADNKHFFTMLGAFMAVDRRARTIFEIFEISLSGGNAKYELLLQSRLEECSLKIKKAQLDKVEMYWCGEVPLINVKQDLKRVALAKPGLELKQDSQPNVLQGKGPEVSDMKAEAETKMDMMQHALEENGQLKEERMSKEEMDLEADKLLAPEWSEADELENFAEAAKQPDFKGLMLRQHNLNTKELEKHVDAEQSNYIVKVETEAKENRMQLKEAKQSLKVEKDWQGSAPLVFDKQDLVEVSLTKKVEMKLMHVLKAEAVQVRNSKQKLMKEEHWVFCKQYLEVAVCEKEGREALQLLVDKQAAAAG